VVMFPEPTAGQVIVRIMLSVARVCICMKLYLGMREQIICFFDTSADLSISLVGDTRQLYRTHYL